MGTVYCFTMLKGCSAQNCIPADLLKYEKMIESPQGCEIHTTQMLPALLAFSIYSLYCHWSVEFTTVRNVRWGLGAETADILLKFGKHCERFKIVSGML